MAAEATMAEIGAALADTGRMRMVTALMAGRALPAGELAWHARVSPQTASGHLARLTAAGILAVIRQGRHRYYRIASPAVAELVETLTVAAAAMPERYRPRSRIDEALAAARLCYDHLAGRLGVALADRLVAEGQLDWSPDGGVLTPEGRHFLVAFGLDLATLQARQRTFCRPCLDWSERRWHLGGAVGAGLAGRFRALGWLVPVKDSRALHLTPEGVAGFRRHFSIEAEAVIDGPAMTQPAASATISSSRITS